MVVLLTLLPGCGVAVLLVVCVALSVLLETVRGGRQQTAAVPMRVVLIPIMRARLRVRCLVCAGETVTVSSTDCCLHRTCLDVAGGGAAVLSCTQRYIEVSDCVL